MAAARPFDVVEAAVPEADEDAVAVAEPEVDDEGLVSVKLFSFVTVAVKPVTFVHAGPIVVLVPATKLTAAHYD